jgi:hypothetical protein
VPADTHRQIAGYFVTAFDLDGRVATLVRSVPADAVLPADVPRLVGEIAVLVDRIRAAIPDSPQKATLEAKIGGGQ